jgi:peptidyl-prolyl cis-trans isomerase SurA
MKKLIFIIISFFFAFSSFAATSSKNYQKNFIVAKVNNKAITNSELDDRYQFVVKVSKIKIEKPSDKKLLLSQILDKMIDEELIRQEAANLKIEVSREEFDQSLEILALQQKKSLPQFKSFFKKNGLSFDNYLKQIESEIMWSKITSSVMRSKVVVTDVEIREFFEQYKFNTDIKKFLISELLISHSENSLKFASKLVEELRQGADFENLVKQFSASISAENQGKIGWVSKSDLDIKIYNSVSKLQKGGYSNPVQMFDGYRIFKLLDTKIETDIAEQDVAKARNLIFTKKLQTFAKGYLMDLRKKSFVEIAKSYLD